MHANRHLCLTAQSWTPKPRTGVLSLSATDFESDWRGKDEPAKSKIGSKMNQLLDKSDSELKTDVLSELKYEPSVRVTDIGVTVTDGTVTLQGIATGNGATVTLSGSVRNYADEEEA
jgi:osmotically-inducible protein OsmY